jgi:multidrug transporter EmrE-like cation transporter
MPGLEPMREVPASSGAPAAPPRPVFLNPYVAIALSVVLDACAQVLLKIGADHSIMHGSVVGISGLLSGWVWLGIIAMVTSFGSWIYSLRFVPLNIAANLTGVVHVLVPLICWSVIGEQIHARRWLGIALVIAGVYTIARPLMKVEEKMEENL